MATKKMLVAMEVKGRLSWVDVTWIHFKLSLTAIWLSFVLTIPSEFLAHYTGTLFFTLWMVSAIGGTTVSIVGLVMSAMTSHLRRAGFRVELVGLMGAIAGPLCYTGISLGDAFTGSLTPGRATVAMLAWALTAALIARSATVVQAAQRREYEAEGIA